MGVLRLNLYGNPSGTFYYIEGLMSFLAKLRAKLNEAESFLVTIEMNASTTVTAISIDDFWWHPKLQR